MARADGGCHRRRGSLAAGPRPRSSLRRSPRPGPRTGIAADSIANVSPLEAIVILLAGLWAGMINTIVGSGSLVTFPTLLALGYHPVEANVSNTVGLVFGSTSGVVGYRRELAGQRSRIIRLGLIGIAGGLSGGILLLTFPGAFEEIVPVLVGAACVLVAVQPRLSRMLARHRHEAAHRSWPLALGTFATAVYGGYFGVAQGVLMIALLGIFLPDDLQRLNALKNVITALVNGVAAILFVLVAPVRWQVAVLIAVGSIVGGQVGALIGRRIPPTPMRAVIIAVGIAAEVKLLL